jgi:O-methyltransferase
MSIGIYKIQMIDKLKIVEKVKTYKGHKRLDGERRADSENYYMTQLNEERLLCNINSIQHIVQNDVDGDIVEIGVWRGGSVLSMLLTLESLGVFDRTIHLYDTFDGMTKPTEFDVFNGVHANEFTKIHYNSDDISEMCKILVDEVKNNIKTNSTYPSNLINYHKGDILKNTFFPTKISVLRLDTDWYESTKFELENFYDLVSENGVIIIDDYNCWDGAKKAVHEFLEDRKLIVNLIDATQGAVYFYKP